MLGLVLPVASLEDILQNEDAELRLTSTGGNSKVCFAVPAVEPLKPVERVGLIMAIAPAGMLDLMLTVFIVFVTNFLGTQPIWGRQGE